MDPEEKTVAIESNSPDLVEEEDDVDPGSTPPGSFVLTLPLVASPSQHSRLDKIFRCSNNCVNQLIENRKTALGEMLRTKRWRNIETGIQGLNLQIAPLRKIKEENRSDEQKAKLEELLGARADLYRQKEEMKKEYGFTKSDFQSLMKKYRSHYSNLIDAATGQKLADEVWTKFKAYFAGKTDQIKFSPWQEFTSIEGKSNRQGIVYGNGYIQFRSDRSRRRKGKSKHAAWKHRNGLYPPESKESPPEESEKDESDPETEDESEGECKKVERCPFNPKDGMIIPVGMSRPRHVQKPGSGQSNRKETSATMFEKECLTHRVKYCRIIRKHYRNGWKYFVQLVLEGPLPMKRNPETGEELYPLGKGQVGQDPAPRTIAVTGDNECLLTEIAEGIRPKHHRIQRLQRTMDRSRRVTNPPMFDDTGQIVPINKLPPECVKNEKRNWVKSKRYLWLEQHLRSAHRQLRELRLTKHRQLANKIVQMGDDFCYEKMNWAALAKKAKKDSDKAKAEKGTKGRKKSAQKKTGGTETTAPVSESAPVQVDEMKKKPTRRKRFGRSIESKAPATLEKCIAWAVKKRGGTFRYAKTAKCKASQFNHKTQECEKVGLDVRVKIIGGRLVNRDLYSSDLMKYVDESGEAYRLEEMDENFEHFMELHDAEIRRLLALKRSGVRLPASIDLREFEKIF